LSDKLFWIKICKNKIQNFVDYDAFKLVEYFKNVDILIILNKWMFRYKYEFNNQIFKQKIRYVIRKFIQYYNLNYKEIFVSILKFIIFQDFFTLVIFFDIKIK